MQPTQVSPALAQIRSRSVAGLRETVIVMTVLRHPALLAEHFDAFAHVELTNRELDSLRSQILEIAAEDPHISTEGLDGRLDGAGFRELVERLDRHLREGGIWQASAGASEQDALDGWRQALALHHRARTLHKELKDAEAALAEKVGPLILVTHSHSGGFGWITAIKNQNVKAIVSYEPGSGFLFPEGEVPVPVESSAGPLVATAIPKEEFQKLTKIPIVIYYGDFIPEKYDAGNPGADGWRARLEMARKWRDVVNEHGGDVTVVHLPEIGIKGNTHFPFSDLNNIEVADVMSKWLAEKELDN